MADSKKEEGRDDNDRPFDYTDSKKEEAGHGDEKGAGHDDDDHPLDYTDSKKDEGHDDDDNDDYDLFHYNLQVLSQVAEDFLRGDYPEGYAGAGEERSPPLQRPQEYCSTHGVEKKKPRSFPEKRSINKKRRVSPPTSSLNPASTPDVDKFVKSSSPSRGKAKLQESASPGTSTTDSDNPCQMLGRWGVSKRRSRRIYSNSGEGTSTDRRLQRDLAAGAERAADHQPPPPPAAPQAGRTWREVHRDQMGGGKVVRLGKKTVHRSDKSKHQSRLLLPQGLESQVFKHATRGEEEEINAAGLRVEVLDYYGERFMMTCKYRKCHKGMVFNGGWTHFLDEHEESHLREGESLLLLAFRSQQQRLCFVFVPQHLQDEDQRQHHR